MTDETDYDAAGAAIQAQLWGERVGGSTPPAMPGAKLAPDYFALVRKFCFGMFWSKEELIEVLMQAGVYAGVPVGVAALNTAGPVLGTD